MPEFQPQFFGPEEISEISGVDLGRVNEWIALEKVPYLETPEGEIKIPFQSFLVAMEVEACKIFGAFLSLSALVFPNQHLAAY